MGDEYPVGLGSTRTKTKEAHHRQRRSDDTRTATGRFRDALQDFTATTCATYNKTIERASHATIASCIIHAGAPLPTARRPQTPHVTAVRRWIIIFSSTPTAPSEGVLRSPRYWKNRIAFQTPRIELIYIHTYISPAPRSARLKSRRTRITPAITKRTLTSGFFQQRGGLGVYQQGSVAIDFLGANNSTQVSDTYAPALYVHVRRDPNLD